jgi:hypothetical protein
MSTLIKSDFHHTKEESFLAVVLGIYVFLIMTGLPLIFGDKYFDILVVKYCFFCICTIVMLVLVLGYFIVLNRTRVSSNHKNVTLKSILKQLDLSDYTALIFLIVSMISTISSDFGYESFWGNEGRYTGLFLIGLYVASYFCISRFWVFKSWYFNCFLIVGIVVCIFGITDYFQMDILCFKKTMLESQKAIFTSTLGNINTYTAYVGVIMAVAMVLFTTCEKVKMMIWYYVCMLFSFFAIIMGVSDNAYLSLGALFGFLPLYLFGSRIGIKRYFVAVATLFSVFQCIDWINIVQGDKVLGIHSAFNIVISFKGLHYLVVVLWLACVILHRNDFNIKWKHKEYGHLFRYIWLGILALILITILYMFYDCNMAGNAKRYESLSSYLLFNDDWGSHRGYIWRNAVECFSEFSVWKKVFGYGPETFGILLLQRTSGNKYHEIFDNAHNEYLHCLITLGIAGLVSYILFLLSCIRKCFRTKNHNSYFVAVAFGIICYSSQALVNLNLPIVTPVLWIFLGISAAKSIEK